MFGFFRKKRPEQNPASESAAILKALGFDLLPYGAGVAIASHFSGYSPHESASLIASTTLALEIRNANNNVMVLMMVAAHATAVSRRLAGFAQQGLMRKDIFDNDMQALLGLITIDADQKKWVDRLLSDPVAGKERLANSRISYLRV
jgi:hypothetical protein